MALYTQEYNENNIESNQRRAHARAGRERERKKMSPSINLIAIH